MNQSDTPETDGLYNPEMGWTGVVPIEHARKLERERDEAIRKLDLAEDIITRMSDSRKPAKETSSKLDI